MKEQSYILFCYELGRSNLLLYPRALYHYFKGYEKPTILHDAWLYFLLKREYAYVSEKFVLSDDIYQYYPSYKAYLLGSSKARLHKSPLPEDTALIQGLTIPEYCNNEDESWIEVYQDLRHYKNQAFWDSLSSEHQAMGKLRFKNVIRPLMFKDIGEDQFHTTIKPQFITGLYDENRVALIRNLGISPTGGVINLSIPGPYDISFSEMTKVQLYNMMEKPISEAIGRTLPFVEFLPKGFTSFTTSVELLPNSNVEVIHEPLLKGSVESTSLFKDMVSDQRYQKIGSVAINNLNLPEDVVSVKPVYIPGWNGGAFVPPPPIFLTMPFLQALARIVIRKAKRMIIQMILRILLRILLTIAINLLIRLLRMIKDKVQAIVKSTKEKN